MTSAQRQHWAKAAERPINIRALCDDLPCNQMAFLQVDKELEWWVQKGKELNLWNQGDENRVVLDHPISPHIAPVPLVCSLTPCWAAPTCAALWHHFNPIV